MGYWFSSYFKGAGGGGRAVWVQIIATSPVSVLFLSCIKEIKIGWFDKNHILQFRPFHYVPYRFYVQSLLHISSSWTTSAHRLTNLCPLSLWLGNYNFPIQQRSNTLYAWLPVVRWLICYSWYTTGALPNGSWAKPGLKSMFHVWELNRLFWE